MMLRILLGILFVAPVSAMQNSPEPKQSVSDQESKQLYRIMTRAHSIINETNLFENDDKFDPSEKSLLPKVQALLGKGADPNYKLAFRFLMDDGEKFGVPLPTSMELAQELKYQEIVNLFFAQNKS